MAEAGGGLSLHPLPACLSRLMGFRWSLGSEILKIARLFLMSWEKSHLGPRTAGERAPVKGLHRGSGVYWGGNGARGSRGAGGHMCTAAASLARFSRGPRDPAHTCAAPQAGEKKTQPKTPRIALALRKSLWGSAPAGSILHSAAAWPPWGRGPPGSTVPGHIRARYWQVKGPRGCLYSKKAIKSLWWAPCRRWCHAPQLITGPSPRSHCSGGK